MNPELAQLQHDMGHKPTSRRAILSAIEDAKLDMADISEKIKGASGLLERNLYRAQFKNRQTIEKRLLELLNEKTKQP